MAAPSLPIVDEIDTVYCVAWPATVIGSAPAASGGPANASGRRNAASVTCTVSVEIVFGGGDTRDIGEPVCSVTVTRRSIAWLAVSVRFAAPPATTRSLDIATCTALP